MDSAHAEKHAGDETPPQVGTAELQEDTVYITDTNVEGRGNLRLAKDDHTVLIPQPSDDPNDPLNWSDYKKHVVLFVISFAAFLPDYGSAVGAVTLMPQAMYVTLCAVHHEK